MLLDKVTGTGRVGFDSEIQAELRYRSALCEGMFKRGAQVQSAEPSHRITPVVECLFS